jgi:hypothetical protein
MGGALPSESRNLKVQTVVDTPLKRAVRELHTSWQPLYGGVQVTPPFQQMRHVARNYDNTQFVKTNREYPMPTHAPTGKGALYDHRETSHYVSKVLRSIHPSLARVYNHGATNEAHHDVATNLHMEEHVRAGPLGGLRKHTRKFSHRQHYPKKYVQLQ